MRDFLGYLPIYPVLIIFNFLPQYTFLCHNIRSWGSLLNVYCQVLIKLSSYQIFSFFRNMKFWCFFNQKIGCNCFAENYLPLMTITRKLVKTQGKISILNVFFSIIWHSVCLLKINSFQNTKYTFDNLTSMKNTSFDIKCTVLNFNNFQNRVYHRKVPRFCVNELLKRSSTDLH